MRIKFYLLILLGLSLAAISAVSTQAQQPGRQTAGIQNYTFRQITVLDGLPDDAVKTLFTVPDGRLGIRTPFGLSFYDGCDFRNFPAGRSELAYPLDFISARPYIYLDNNLRIWDKETGALAVFDIRRETYIHNVDSLLKTIGIQGRIINMFISHKTHLWWVDTRRTLWYRNLSEADAVPRRFPLTGRGLRDIAFYRESVWLAYDNGVVVNASLNGRILRKERLWSEVVPPRYPVALRESRDGLWCLWNKGAAFFQPSSGRWNIQLIKQAEDGSTIDLEAGPHGMAWAGVEQKGLFLLNGPARRIQQEIPLVSVTGDDFRNDVQSILFSPASGNLWLGLYTRGLAYYNPAMEMLPMIDFKRRNLVFDNNLQITPLQDGRLLLITSPRPLIYNPLTGQITPAWAELENVRSISAFQDSKGRIWVGTFRNGFYEIQNNHVICHNITRTEGDVAFNLVRGFIEDNQGRLYVNFHGGLGIYNEQTQLIDPLYRRHPELKTYLVINRMAKDRNGCLWIAARQGVYKYDPLHDKVYQARDIGRRQSDIDLLASDSKAMFCDSRGLMWFGTNTGLHVWNDRSKRFEDIPGLPDKVVQAVVEDSSHNIWVSTANGLCRITIRQAGTGYSYSTQFFEKSFRLTDSEFLANSAYADNNGHVYLGCTTGLYTIQSSRVTKAVYTGHPLITSFYLFDKEVIPGKKFNKRIILKDAAAYTRSLRLNYNENFFTLHFSGLNFADPEHTWYRYRLKGIDKEWIEISPKDGKGIASYTNLSPGTYTFEVYSAGSDKQWSRDAATMEITIDAPLWATWWAKSFYVLMLLGSIFYYFRYREMRSKIRLERQKEKELDEMKYRFFTNISHEFRTLLTLIITPLGSVLKKMDKGALQDELKIVSRNAGDLLQLVNQLLDFRKLEMSGEHLNLLNGQIGEFAEVVTEKFRPLTKQKHIHLHFTDETHALYMFFDRDKVHKIMDNLLSNACKFTPSGGSVTVTVRRGQSENNTPVVELEVKDTGCGMSEESMKHIFDRFYRVESEAGRHIGSGIGLNLVQEYVKLHKGHLSVTSREGEGSTFTLQLPSDLKAESPSTTDMPAEVSETASTVSGTEDAQKTPVSDTEENKDTTSGRTLLVVEDNEEFRRFMARELGEHYHILLAADGIEGVLKAEEHNPDLIISDIMMPRMNGIDLCRRIKSCLPTSHIPVILLTAKGSDRARTEGYEAGADAYISKPFDMEVLLARIQNLLRKQGERRQEFAHSITLDPKEVSITSRDEEFMQQAMNCIEKHIAEPEYMTDNLASDVAMSRMSLYRKVKAVTGQTPADFIRTVRLKHAAMLLKTGLSVSEVCDKTGFATPQNFTKRFREMFGVLPSQYK